MAEATILRATRLPRPTRLCTECPSCGAELDYEPAEDDAGAFYAEHDWPTCEACNIVVEVHPVRIIEALGVYLARGN